MVTVWLIPVAGGYAVPDGRAAGLVEVSLSEALHADIRPLGAAERLLRAAVTGVEPEAEGLPDDPVGERVHRTRAGAIVVRDGRILLVQARPDGSGRGCFEIPGGGLENGERPEEAAVRELAEESGLAGVVVREIATVYHQWRGEPRLWLGHYFLMEAAGEISDRFDLPSGERPVWVEVGALASLPVWPRRLAWRLGHWIEHGWPKAPLALFDRNHDLVERCDW
ncbi:NUDIX hydrolase [Phytomonospora sp. NPDC050363]|uniref:NUDIX hydrolase n=1 Tax=Phytomonospora sp. NPDC050363 TaxID=3155642 RepID=UPI0033EBD079